ncbi:MAG: sulfatase-like hydrolase/transferase, partial [Cyclobacteriaceae bacterium]|nr:sulfatase-like hydrolase/transferase [Cyclobacteriaceae bacterium]
GYQTVWGGKWHLPESYPLRGKSTQRTIPGFEPLHFYDTIRNYPEWGYGDTTDTYLADAAVSFIEGYANEKPFLLAVSFCNPHDICYIPRKPERYPFPSKMDDLPPLPENFEIIPDEPDLIQKKRKLEYYGDEIVFTDEYNSTDWQNYIYHYYRMTERVDQQIGRVLNALKEKGLDENTLIIFTSDHGDGAGSHKWAAKLNLYEESTKVPFIISWKGKITPGVNQRLISGLDVLPTMCDYAGIDMPASFLGKSLKSVLENPEAESNGFVVTELATDPKNPEWKGRMIRMNQYKYNLYSKGERNEQLFDLADDPGEMQNLASESNMQEVKESLRNKLVKWMEETDDDFLDVWEGI